MSARPSDEVFIEWVKNDQNKFNVQNALRLHPDLINAKASGVFSVSFNQLHFLIIIFTF